MLLSMALCTLLNLFLNQALEPKAGRLVSSMLANGETTSATALGLVHGQTEVSIAENGRLENIMVTEHIFGQAETPTRASGFADLKKDAEPSPGKTTVSDTKENTRMVKSVDLALLPGLMVRSTRENGAITSAMERVSTSTRMA